MRRLDSDAAAVQVMTVWVSKGLQYPIVYLPFAFNRNVKTRDLVLFHDDDGTRCLHIGGDAARICMTRSSATASRRPATTSARPTSR